MIDALLAAGADPNAATTTGTTPLMLAAASGKADAVKRAARARRATSTRRKLAHGETALMFAAAYGPRATPSRAADAPHGADVRASRPKRRSTGVSPGRERSRAVRRQRRRAGRAPAPRRRGGRGAGAAGSPASTVSICSTSWSATRAASRRCCIAARQGDADVGRGAARRRRRRQPARAPATSTTPLLIATINGHFDLATHLLDARRGPEPRASDNGVTPLYAALNCSGRRKALYPQPRAYQQQHASYLDLMSALLDKGADPNARLQQKVWYSATTSISPASTKRARRRSGAPPTPATSTR